MFSAFLGGVKGYFGKGFVLAVWVPVLIASFAILMTVAGTQAKLECYWKNWLALGSELQTFVGIIVFFIITLIAFFLHHLQLQITQFFEGYWPEIGAIGKFKYWKRRRYIHQFRNIHAFLKILGEKIPLLEEKIRRLEMRLNTMPITWLLLRQYNCLAGILFLRESQTNLQSDQLQQSKNKLQRDWGRFRQKQKILSKEFPALEDEILATSFGNRYRSAEVYPFVRYGIDSVVFWPRLLEVVPEGLQGRLQDAKIAVDFWLLCSLLCALYTGVAFVCTIFLEFWAIGLVLLGAALTVFCYRAALPPVMAYGELIRVAFDLYGVEPRYM